MCAGQKSIDDGKMRREDDKLLRGHAETVSPEKSFDLLTLDANALDDPKRIILLEKGDPPLALLQVGRASDFDQIPQRNRQSNGTRGDGRVDLGPPVLVGNSTVIDIEVWHLHGLAGAGRESKIKALAPDVG
jgi:hypothetical protein